MPQVVIPQHYDQYYWAGRVRQLGIGVAHASTIPTVDTLTGALEQALQPDVNARTQSIADEIRTDGARVAARRLISVGL